MKTDRLKLTFGSFLTILGVLTIVIVGAFYGYHQTTIWVAGFLLIVGGVLIAKSTALANFLNDILRF